MQAKRRALCAVVLLALGWVAAASGVRAAGPVVLKGPYVQNVTTSSADICWETDTPVDGQVQYGRDASYGSTAVSEERAKSRCLTLAPLEPYATYHYQVASGGALLSEDASFRTMAPPQQDNVSFVVWADNRTNDQVHKRLADRIAAADPDFVLDAGDLVADGNIKSQWHTFFDVERKLMSGAPVYPVLGNHENDSPNYFTLFDLPGNERWYSFDSGPLHVVGLDVVFSSFEPGSEQYRWLEQDLASTTHPWKLVFMHFPPYSSSRPQGSNEEAQRYLVPLFEKYGVQLVVSGHAHNYERSMLNGVTYLVAGGGGAPLHVSGKGPLTIYSETTYHFVKIDIEGGVLTAIPERDDGTRFDPFAMRLPGRAAPQSAPVELVAAPAEAEPENGNPPAHSSNRTLCSACHDDVLMTVSSTFNPGHLPTVGGVAAAFTGVGLVYLSNVRGRPRTRR